MNISKSIKRLRIECHPDKHEGNHSLMERVYAALQRPSQAMSAVRRCRVCGVRIGGVKTCLAHRYTSLALSCCVLMVGCKTPNTKLQTPRLDVLRTMPRVTHTATADTAAVAAPRMLGCRWDAPVGYDPSTQYFEVWSTTDLTQPFILRTNTQATVALFPEQPAEFYMVRTANTNGQVSDWATTKKGNE